MDRPGVAGRIKTQPADFVVEEIPLYEACGMGPHVYLRLRRAGATTREVQQRLARAFDLAERDIGCAGLKDRVSIATQTFSLPLDHGEAAAIAERAATATGFEVLAAARHGNKLRRGHLLGNRFDILVRDVPPDALARAHAACAALAARGVPNRFGEQRLGPGARNARRGAEQLGQRANSWTGRFQLSALQGQLFNSWIEHRAALGCLDRVLSGDVAKKLATGGLFEVLDPDLEQRRLDAGAITITGPIYGRRMRAPSGRPAEIEREILDAAGIAPEDFARSRLEGSRRPARVPVGDVEIETDPAGLRLRFRLPKGAYATSVLDELLGPRATPPAA